MRAGTFVIAPIRDLTRAVCFVTGAGLLGVASLPIRQAGTLRSLKNCKLISEQNTICIAAGSREPACRQAGTGA